MKHRTTILFAAALLCTFTASPVLAADFLAVDYSDSGIEFTPNVAADYFELRVAGPEDLVFTQSETFFALSDELGSLPDGVYTWEVVLVTSFDAAPLPSDDSKRGLEKGLDHRIAENINRASGSFSIRKGILVDRNLKEPGTAVDEKLSIHTKTEVVNDNQVVLGSLCVGVDCSNNPSFGFDVIRMKENNLRIKAEDTSSTGSFPSNDWQLSFNDTANGGVDRFSVDDVTGNKTPFTIIAGAPSNSLYVNSEGDVGLGSANPAVELHMIDGNSPAMRLEQDGSSGFQRQVWDVAGNETNFFIRDVTNNSNLPFRIKPGAPENAIFVAADGDIALGNQNPQGALHVNNSGASTAFVVDADGNIGSGNTDPQKALHLTRDGGVVFRMENTAASNDGWDFAAFNNGTIVFSDPDDGNAEFILDDAGNLTITGTLSDSSDVRMKENFSAIDSGEVLRKVVDLPITTWNYLHTPEQEHLGPTAQDFFAAFGLGAGETVVQSRNMAGVALAAVQGLDEKNEAEIDELKARIAALEALVEKLTAE